ncbi:MAG: hypothetical protein FWG99_03245 [Treponema sp.]|nr:hypothetical protein [Treponema sp.]
MKINKIVFMLLLFVIAAAGAWAQNLPGNIWSSPQSITTEGRYRSNADDFIRPDTYTNVNFNKWFGLVSFLWDETFSPVATAGFATQVKNVYISAFYTGNFWSGAPVNNYTREEPGTVPNGGSAGKVYDVYSTISLGGTTNPVNNAAVLIGLADMGFRLTYRTDYQFFNKKDIVTANQLYSSYQLERGYLAPQIAWAMAKNLTGNGIRPYATLDLVFDRDYQKTKTNGPDSAGNTGEYIGRSLNHFDPSLAIGMGGYTLYREGAFSLSTDIDYALAFNIYNNEYSYIEGKAYKTGKINGTFSPGSNPYVEQFFVSNMLTPSLSSSWSKDRLALRFKLNLPLTLTSQEQNSMSVGGSGSLVYNGTSNSTVTFIFRPDLRLAMQYKIIPDRFTLNTGARIQATAATLQTVNQDYYTAGNKTTSRKILQDSSGSGFASRFHIGLTFNIAENLWVESTTGVSNAYGDDAIDLFAPGGLFSFGSILAALRF